MTDKEKVDAVLAFIEGFGEEDGAHHKQWALDQIVRLLMDDEKTYQMWRGKLAIEGYGWDEGIAP